MCKFCKKKMLIQVAQLGFSVHPHMLRRSTGFKLANDGQDTRSIQHYLGHKNIQNTVRYTEINPRLHYFSGYLFDAVTEMNNGLYDANLGGNVYKKRIPVDNKGKRGGARTIIAFKYNDKAFLYIVLQKTNKIILAKKNLRH